MSDELNRNNFIDYIKGILIFLMLWGHCIQFLLPSKLDFFNNIVFKFIYSFHMPLFILISGLLFGKKLYKIQNDKDKLYGYIGKKILSLSKIIIMSGIIYTLIVNLIYHQFNILFAFDSLKSFWFLWSLLCITIVCGVAYLYTERLFLRILLLIIAIPFIWNMPNNDMNLFMYPFFIIGVLYETYYKKIPSKLFNIKYLSLILFPILLMFFEKKHYIYITGFSFDSKNFCYSFGVGLFRFFIGLVGCIFALIIFKFIYKFKNNLVSYINDLFIKVGMNTLAIYILSVPLLSILLPIISRFIYLRYSNIEIWITNNMLLFNVVITPFVAILYIIFLSYLIKLLEVIKVKKVLFK